MGAVMNIFIETKDIEAILLRDNQWYEVAEGTLTTCAYRFVKNAQFGATCGLSHGVRWTDKKTGKKMACAFSEIGAVRYTRDIQAPWEHDEE
jgi:hypothetical protein